MEHAVENYPNIILVALSSGVIGILLGALLAWRFARPQSRQTLESRLQEAEQKLQRQQAQVTEHFNHTAALVSKLTRDYRDLHDYLASSAQQIGHIDIQPVMLGDIKATPILGEGAVINPPLDYAPKKGNLGTLNEAYGLREEVPAKPPGSADAYSDA